MFNFVRASLPKSWSIFWYLGGIRVSLVEYEDVVEVSEDFINPFWAIKDRIRVENSSAFEHGMSPTYIKKSHI